MTKSIVLFLILLSTQVFADFDETQIQVPPNDSDEEILHGTACKTRDHGHWDICYSINPQEELLMKSFKFTNYGKNKIVPMSGPSIGRDFEFGFEGLARSDMNLLIWDAPDGLDNHIHLKLLYFFPREIMPAIRYENSTLIVTLPTREEVVFNAKTHEILSGALTEGPMKQVSSGAAVAPNVQYSGQGVVIEATALSDWPVGLNAQFSSKLISIKKKGQKTCQVPGKELFYTDASKGENVFMNKKYITDAAFDEYLKARCGFSIY